MSRCKQDLTKEEIFMEFGKDEIMEKCSGCDNLKYCNGIMTCKKLEEGDDE